MCLVPVHPRHQQSRQRDLSHFRIRYHVIFPSNYHVYASFECFHSFLIERTDGWMDGWMDGRIDDGWYRVIRSTFSPLKITLTTSIEYRTWLIRRSYLNLHIICSYVFALWTCCFECKNSRT
jgi:hypothetical protein